MSCQDPVYTSFPVIYKIKNMLGVGAVKFRKTEGRSEMVILRVRNKTHLKTVILPIFDRYPLLSNKQHDYLRFRDALLNNIIHHEILKAMVMIL